MINNWEELGSKMLELYNNRDLNIKMSGNIVALMKGYWNHNLYALCLSSAISKTSLR